MISEPIKETSKKAIKQTVENLPDKNTEESISKTTEIDHLIG